MDKALQLLSLCRKAGRLRIGYDAVALSVQKREAVLVLLADDLAERTERNIRRICESKKVPCRTLPHGMETLSRYTGKHAGVLAVTDPQFAHAILQAANTKDT